MDKNVALITGFLYKELRFRGVFIHTENGNQLAALLEQKDSNIPSEAFLEQIGLSGMLGIFPTVALKRILLKYAIGDPASVLFVCETEDGDRLSISGYGLSLQMEQRLQLKTLPLLGAVLGADDYIQLKKLSVSGRKTFTFSLVSAWKLFGEEFSLSFGETAEDTLYRQEIIAIEGASLCRASTIVSEASAGKITWLKVDKQIRGFTLEQIGFAFRDQMPYLYFDLSFTIGFFRISALGLYLAADIPGFHQIRAGLQGLGINFQSPAFSVRGSFRQVSSRHYEGNLRISFAKSTFIASGIYQKDDRGEHIFVFAGVYLPVGGSPCFYVTGFTAALGLKYQLRMPDLEEMAEFPLLQMLANRKEEDPEQVLAALDQYLSVSPNSYFFNIGMQITSFGVIRTDVLLNVTVKPSFSIHILGRSTVDFPEKGALVHVVLNFSAEYDDTEGALKIIAALQPDSYIWESDCHLTGGFAVFLWLKGEHAKDFVLTVGGYHPSFEAERASRYPHYPAVDRVKINWIISRQVSVTGTGYFALTPSCLMAGGGLSLVFLDGKLKAWLIAYADFLIQWKPWNYDISLGVSVGASYRLDLGIIHKTFQIELGASIHIWGPSFQGKARINWWIISFTVSFGKSDSPKSQVSFADVEALLADTDHNGGDFCQIRLTGGLLKEYSAQEYAVDSENLRLEIHTQVPVTRLTVTQNHETASAYTLKASRPLFVLPMGAGTRLASELDIRIVRESGQFFSIQKEPILENVPYALWGENKITRANADMISDVPTGAEISTKIVNSTDYLPEQGAYDERVLNGIACSLRQYVPLAIGPEEAGKTYTEEQTGFEKIWGAFSGKETYKATLAKRYGLEPEYLGAMIRQENFYHAPIRFCESGKTSGGDGQ